MVRRTQYRGLGGSRVYKLPSGAGKTEITAEMEPVTTIGLGAFAAYVSKDGIGKLLGPTADYLGEGLRDLTRRRGESIGRNILQRLHQVRQSAR